MKYSELTQRYFDAAPLAGTLSGAHVVRAAAGGRERGTWVQFDLRVEAGRISEARFLAFGCPHTLAVAAWMAEWATGTALGALSDAAEQELARLAHRFEVPSDKLGRLLIVEDAWHAVVALAQGH